MTCGDLRYFAKCQKGCDDTPQPIREHCDRMDCPTCRPKVLKKTAMRAGERLKWLMGQGCKLRHYVISFRSKEGSRLEAIMIMKEFGIRGGCIVEHKKEDRLGNHYHVVGWGSRSTIDLVRMLASKYQIVIKCIRKVWNPFKLLAYELDHATLRIGKHVLAWFGAAGNRWIHKEKVKGPLQACLCPKCGGTLAKVWRSEDNPNAALIEVLHRRQTIFIYSWLDMLRLWKI